MELEIKKFGKFKLLKQIARGGMAEIFLASSGSIESAQKFVVIKRILLAHSHNKEFNKMFQNEGKIAVNLNHGNIGALNEFGQEHNQYFICMEYISGRNIRQLVKKIKSQKKNLSVPMCANIIKYVCSGLEYAHNCIDSVTGQPLNIIHRDISPQNIMISFNGDIKVIDFGIAKIEDSEATKVGVLKGKFEYMSPEQARGHKLDKQTDIFSLGNVFWELLAGRKLFTASNEIKLLKKIRDCQVPDVKKFNSAVPDRLIEIIHKSLNPNKNIRYKSMAEMGSDISVFLNKTYPEFTHTHFSSFIKEIYVEEILEERKNLKAYSRALVEYKNLYRPTSSARPDTASKSTFIGYTEDDLTDEENHLTDYYGSNPGESLLDSEDATTSSSFTSSQTELDRNTEYNTETEGMNSVTETKFDDSMEKGDSKALYTRKPSSTVNNQSNISVKPAGTRNMNIIRTNTYNTKLDSADINNKEKLTQYTPWDVPIKQNVQKIIRNSRKSRKSRFIRIFIALFIIAGLLHIIQSREKVQKLIGKKGQPDMMEDGNMDQDPYTRDPAATAPNIPKEVLHKPSKILHKPPTEPKRVRTSVRSNKIVATLNKNVFIITKPAGAQIFVDDQSISQFTPTVLQVPGNKPVRLKFTREGYRDYVVVLSPDDIKSKMKFSLQKINRKRSPNKPIIIR